MACSKNLPSVKDERKREPEEGRDNGYRCVERLHGSFYRRFGLADTADADKISAKGKNGVLEVVIPKKETVEPKRIKVAS
ncbi:MAG: hypothetical protein BMS9Abin01_2843 [Gammaproteobacteria bacterium]|nr:MAG: hypothetical protein BMS9Abin01_2843 [Gammaproteobacteria bacterium]